MFTSDLIIRADVLGRQLLETVEVKTLVDKLLGLRNVQVIYYKQSRKQTEGLLSVSPTFKYFKTDYRVKLMRR